MSSEAFLHFRFPVIAMLFQLLCAVIQCGYERQYRDQRWQWWWWQLWFGFSANMFKNWIHIMSVVQIHCTCFCISHCVTVAVQSLLLSWQRLSWDIMLSYQADARIQKNLTFIFPWHRKHWRHWTIKACEISVVMLADEQVGWNYWWKKQRSSSIVGIYSSSHLSVCAVWFSFLISSPRVSGPPTWNASRGGVEAVGI